MKRRTFLRLFGASLGSCLIPEVIARRILDVSLGNSDPHILTPTAFEVSLYAEKQEDANAYYLHLGDPNADLKCPTLRHFLDISGYDGDDEQSVREYLVDWRSYNENDDETIQGAIESLMSEVDDPIEDGSYEHERWLEGCGEPVGTLPDAYHYLLGMPLKSGNDSGGFDLGSLSFIHCDHPGSNLFYVEADNLSAVVSLQHRLNELDTGARIIVA